jgi:hypothetical protein
MFRLLSACVLIAALTFALTVSLRSHDGLAAVAAEAFAPPCPHAFYGENGNMSPLFCMVDNPLALRYFAPMARRTFALGPNATPGEVTVALISDYVTWPTLCSIYELAAWRNQWRFRVSPIDEVGAKHNLPPGGCPAPSL